MFILTKTFSLCYRIYMLLKENLKSYKRLCKMGNEKEDYWQIAKQISPILPDFTVCYKSKILETNKAILR